MDVIATVFFCYKNLGFAMKQDWVIGVDFFSDQQHW